MDEPNSPSYPSTIGQGSGAPTRGAQSGLDTAKDVAGDIAGQAKDQAGSLVDQVKDKALAAAADQKDGVADQIEGIAQSIHKSGDQFAGQQDWIASAIERGAAELDGLATSLRENDLSSLLSQVKSIARQQPALFIGACLAGGFMLARIGKLVAADVSADDLPTLPEVGHGGQ